MTRVNSLIIQAAGSGMGLQAADGAMPAGCNGPHNHIMTAARNTSHWSVLFLEAYRLTGQSRYAWAGQRALELLLSAPLRPTGGAFWHRKHPGRNSVNGLIGQAWTMEALAFGAHVLNRPAYRDAALEVFDLHPFDSSSGLWWRIELDGRPARLEDTLNQQIWFAAAACLVANSPQANGTELLEAVDAFLDGACGHVSVNRHGLLPLAVNARQRLSEKAVSWYRGLRADGQARRAKEEAYHLFALCGYAQLCRARPDHRFWHQAGFLTALRRPFRANFLGKLKENRFGFAYNVPGFELPYVYEVFRNRIDGPDVMQQVRWAFDHQLARHLDTSSGLLRRSTQDPDTLSARLYELYRLSATTRDLLDRQGQGNKMS